MVGQHHAHHAVHAARAQRNRRAETIVQRRRSSQKNVGKPKAGTQQPPRLHAVGATLLFLMCVSVPFCVVAVVAREELGTGDTVVAGDVDSLSHKRGVVLEENGDPLASLASRARLQADDPSMVPSLVESVQDLAQNQHIATDSAGQRVERPGGGAAGQAQGALDVVAGSGRGRGVSGVEHLEFEGGTLASRDDVEQDEEDEEDDGDGEGEGEEDEDDAIDDSRSALAPSRAQRQDQDQRQRQRQDQDQGAGVDVSDDGGLNPISLNGPYGNDPADTDVFDSSIGGPGREWYPDVGDRAATFRDRDNSAARLVASHLTINEEGFLVPAPGTLEEGSKKRDLGFVKNPKSPLPPRRKHHAPEGSSLRAMIDMAPKQPVDPSLWELYYDEESGHPYYYNKETQETQWENPFGYTGTEESSGALYESWQLYERFDFKGMFDDLTVMQGRSKLPRSGPNLGAMNAIAELANSTFDSAQAKLEVAIFQAERKAYGGEDVPTRRHWSKQESREVLDITEPPASTTPEDRVGLAGAWNDLGNMWYARGEWELCLDCFRKSLFWNPEQTSTLLNMAGVLVKLGFERDGNVVMQYYDSIRGGTMGGWHPHKEEEIRSSIRRGLDLARLSDGSEGHTRGEMQLLGMLPDEDYVKRLTAESNAEWTDETLVHIGSSGNALNVGHAEDVGAHGGNLGHPQGVAELLAEGDLSAWATVFGTVCLAVFVRALQRHENGETWRKIQRCDCCCGRKKKKSSSFRSRMPEALKRSLASERSPAGGSTPLSPSEMRSPGKTPSRVPPFRSPRSRPTTPNEAHIGSPPSSKHETMGSPVSTPRSPPGLRSPRQARSRRLQRSPSFGE